MTTLQDWRARMLEDMRLRDFRPRTQQGYLAATRQFMDWVKLDPEALTDEHVRQYFLHLREKRKLAPSSINIAVHALRFFCVHTLGRDWAIFGLLRVNKPQKLPVVLSRNSRTHQQRVMTLAAHEFLRRFLQHVLPKGMHRVRAFGLLHRHDRATLRRLQLLLAPRQAPEPPDVEDKQPPLRCAHCDNAPLRLLRRLTPDQCAHYASLGATVVTPKTARARGPPGWNDSARSAS